MSDDPRPTLTPGTASRIAHRIEAHLDSIRAAGDAEPDRRREHEDAIRREVEMLRAAAAPPGRARRDAAEIDEAIEAYRRAAIAEHVTGTDRSASIRATRAAVVTLQDAHDALLAAIAGMSAGVPRDLRATLIDLADDLLDVPVGGPASPTVARIRLVAGKLREIAAVLPASPETRAEGTT